MSFLPARTPPPNFHRLRPLCIDSTKWWTYNINRRWRFTDANITWKRVSFWEICYEFRCFRGRNAKLVSSLFYFSMSESRESKKSRTHELCAHHANIHRMEKKNPKKRTSYHLYLAHIFKIYIGECMRFCRKCWVSDVGCTVWDAECGTFAFNHHAKCQVFINVG